MKLPIVTRPRAAAEIEAGYRWYEQERPGLGEEFLEAVTHIVGVIAGHPERFPIVHRDTRRVLLSRFPFAIFLSPKGGTCRRCSLLPFQEKSARMEVTSLIIEEHLRDVCLPVLGDILFCKVVYPTYLGKLRFI